MKILQLTPEDKRRLEEQHAAEKDGKARDRLKAILLYSEGWTMPEISQALRLHQSTVMRHIQDYKLGKLKNESGGSKSHLTDIQTQELITHLEQTTYHHNYEIVLYVKERFGITFTVAGMHKWLHRNGFSYKKPKGLPHKAAPELQQAFIEKYEALKDHIAFYPGKFDECLVNDEKVEAQKGDFYGGWITKNIKGPFKGGPGTWGW